MRCFLKPGDTVRLISDNAERVLLVYRRGRHEPRYWLYGTVDSAAPPTRSQDRFLVRARLRGAPNAPNLLVLTGEAIRGYFYRLHAPITLYAIFGLSDVATTADLRTAARIKQLEVGEDVTNRIQMERAFNILANPELRRCYNSLRRDENTPPLFPYGGSGAILVQGHVMPDGESFFADRILAFKPDLTSKRVALLLRQCDFLPEHITCRDARRKVEVWLDGNLLPGLNWDLTWNQWKHWLKSRIQVDATFVRTTKHRFENGRWISFDWYTGLPSRLRVTIPTDVAEDIQRARTIHALLGEHADVIERIRAEVEKQPIDHLQVRDWLDHLSASTHLKPEHVTWRPDYEPYYFDQLRKRAATWVLFRDEYLFIWANVVISEIPQAGHATYTFAKPADLDDFLRRYARVTRQDVRRNRDNVATELGFVGRIVRGTKRKRWLIDVLKQAGERTDYLEVLE